MAMMAYAVGIAALCHAAGRPLDFNIGLYVGPLFAGYFFSALTIFIVLVLRRLLGRAEKRLLWFRRAWRVEEFLLRLAWAAPFLVTMPFFMAAFTAMKNLLNDTVPFAWDGEFSRLGRLLGFGHHTYEWLFIKNPFATHILEFTYASWGVLLIAAPFAVSLRQPDCPLRTRFLVSYALILVALGNITAGIFMSAGPFWLDHHSGGGNDYAALFDYLNQADADGPFSAVLFQKYLMDAHQMDRAYFGTGISAFPSIHVAIATLFALFAWPFGRIARFISLAFLAMIFIGSVLLGWHYSVDGYAAIAGTCAIYRMVGWAQHRLGGGQAPRQTAIPEPHFSLGRAA